MAPACEQFATMNAAADDCDAGTHTGAGVEKSVGRQTELKPRYRYHCFVHYLADPQAATPPASCLVASYTDHAIVASVATINAK